MMESLIERAFLFLCGHALADTALQTSWIATNKSRHAKDSGLPKGGWVFVLSCHALIHGLMVYLITGSATLGIFETVAHAAIDFGKCEGWYSFYTDQCFHLVCKGIYLWMM